MIASHRFLLGALVALMAATAAAQSDPMRPLGARASAPEGPAAPGVIPNAKGAAPRAAGPDGTAAEPPAPVTLVAIRQDADGRWRALVGERWLAVGDKLDNRRVTAIEANRLELMQGKQRTQVHLLPPLEPSAPAASAAASASPPAAPKPRRAAAPGSDRNRKP